MKVTVTDITLILVLLIAVATDLRWRKIPNVLTVTALIAALIMNAFAGGTAGFWFGMKGFGVGVAVMLLPFAMGGMGGGDVKLMGVVGAFKGAAFAFSAFVCTAVAGGIIALIYILIKGNLKSSINNTKQNLIYASSGNMNYSGEKEKGAIPYACAIFAGTAAAYYAAPLFF